MLRPRGRQAGQLCRWLQQDMALGPDLEAMWAAVFFFREKKCVFPSSAGWWFGTLFFHVFPIGKFTIPTDELIVSEG